jgi:3-oxoadipate enol-lactonase
MWSRQMHFIEANSITLHVRQEGNESGETQIFVNSLGTDLRIWDAVVDPLMNEYNMIRYDKRGHGLSDCPKTPYTIRDHTDDLVGLLDALNIENVVLIGISVGGMIAMDFAVQHPEIVKGLVVCDSLPNIGTSEMWNERINTLRQGGMASLGDTILSRWFTPSYKEQYPAEYRGYYNMLTRMPITGYTGTCEAIRDADLTEATKFIQCPTLLLCGAEDVSTPPSVMQGLTEIMPNARYVEIEAAGHLPCIENPQAVVTAMLSFLKEVFNAR